jgi:hypothetical protein
MKPPSAALLRSDPDGYAQQLEAYQYYTAQRESAQRDADKARAEQAQIQRPEPSTKRKRFASNLRPNCRKSSTPRPDRSSPKS